MKTGDSARMKSFANSPLSWFIQWEQRSTFILMLATLQFTTTKPSTAKQENLQSSTWVAIALKKRRSGWVQKILDITHKKFRAVFSGWAPQIKQRALQLVCTHPYSILMKMPLKQAWA